MNGNYEVKWSEPAVVEQAGTVRRTKLMEDVSMVINDGFVWFNQGGMIRLVIPRDRLLSVEAVNG